MVDSVATIPLPGEMLGVSGGLHGGSASRIALRSFFAGPENALVDVAVRSIFEPGARRYSPLVLVGPSGVGKSHVAWGLARRWTKSGQRGQVLCLTARDFARELARDAASHCLSKFQARYRTAALLIVEDITDLAGKQTACLELAGTIDAVQQAGGTVLVTSQLTPHAVPGLAAVLVSRLAAGLLILLSMPDVAARRAILCELAQSRGIALSPSAAQILAERLALSVPELLAALLEVNGASPVIDAQAATDYVQQRTERNRPTLSLIVTTVARRTAFTIKQLKSANRSRSLVAARNIAIYLARVLTESSLESIGKFFGDRDHTTILHSIRRIEDLLTSDPLTRDTIASLHKELERP